MSFEQLRVDELKNVADFFTVDVEPGNPEKGPTKKELLAALASGDEPVTWKQYNEIYLPALEEYAEVEVVEQPEPVVEVTPVVDESPKILLKMERPNGRFEIRGYVFTREHPFRPVDEENAEYILSHLEGFRQAMPKEIADYYR